MNYHSKNHAFLKNLPTVVCLFLYPHFAEDGGVQVESKTMTVLRKKIYDRFENKSSSFHNSAMYEALQIVITNTKKRDK